MTVWPLGPEFPIGKLLPYGLIAFLQIAMVMAVGFLWFQVPMAGTLAPVESMPKFLQRASVLSPLRHYMDVILGISLKGAGLAELWPRGLALLAIGTVLYATAWAVFRREFG